MKQDLKYKAVVEYLTAMIRSRKIATGDRTPSEQDLAQRCGVSYMTARRAVTELVESNILERISGSGTYVRSAAYERLAMTLNLICTAYEAPTIKPFLREADRQARLYGWRTNIIRLPLGETHRAERAILGEGGGHGGGVSMLIADMTYMDSPIIQAMKQANGRAVLIGGRLEAPEVPCVRADAMTAVKVAVEYLRKHGHRKIVYMTENPQWQMDKIRVSAWESCFPDLSERELKERLIVVGTPFCECPAHYAYQALSKYLASSSCDATAIICSIAEMTFGAVSACRDAGLQVPEQVSILTLQDSSLANFFTPPVTCVDEDVGLQAKLGVQALYRIVMENSTSSEDWIQWVPPKLIERESVMTIHSADVPVVSSLVCNR